MRFGAPSYPPGTCWVGCRAHWLDTAKCCPMTPAHIYANNIRLLHVFATQGKIHQKLLHTGPGDLVHSPQYLLIRTLPTCWKERIPILVNLIVRISFDSRLPDFRFLDLQTLRFPDSRLPAGMSGGHLAWGAIWTRMKWSCKKILAVALAQLPIEIRFQSLSKTQAGKQGGTKPHYRTTASLYLQRHI